MKIGLTLGLIYLFSLASWAQTIHPIYLDNEPEWSLSQHTYLYRTPERITPDQLFSAIPHLQLTTITKSHINLGLESHDVWLYFQLKNDDTAKTILFTFDGISVHEVACFRRRNHVIDTLALTGDAVPFQNRPVQVNFYAIPIPMAAHESAEISVRLTKRNETISGNLNLYSTAQFLQKVRLDSAVFAFFLGVAGFLYLFNFFLWFSLNDRVHLFFMAHQIGIVLYVLTSLGYGFEFLWPNHLYSNSLTMTMLSGVWASTNLFLMKRFLNLTPATSRFTNAIDWLALYILFISIVGCSSALLWNASLPTSILKFGEALLMTWIVANATLLVATVVEQIRQRNQAAYLYTIALSVILTGSVVYLFTLLNLVNAGHFTINWLIPGFLWEEAIIAFGLTVRYNRFRQQNFDLQLSLTESRNQSTLQILNTQEAERQRLAADLHDDLGGTLATIRQHLSVIRQQLRDPQAAKQLDALEPLIQKSGHDLRRIAHNLMPPDFARLGLRHALDQLIHDQPSHTTRFTFIVAGQVRSLPVDVELNLYRIVSEAVQNIHKHAQAGRAAVQLIYHGDRLVITVEDDGLGNQLLTNTNKTVGIGLKNSSLRAEYIGATIWRDANEAGTLVVLEIPYPTPLYAVHTSLPDSID